MIDEEVRGESTRGEIEDETKREEESSEGREGRGHPTKTEALEGSAGSMHSHQEPVKTRRHAGALQALLSASGLE